MDQLLQHLLNGLVLGGTYALLGIGLTLIFGLMDVVNFAHGEFYSLGAYATFAGLSLADLNFFAALGVAIVCGIALGALTERVLLRPLRGHSIDTVMLVMIGVWISMQNGELLLWGGVAKSIAHPFPTSPLTLGGLSLAPLRLFVLAAAIGLVVGAHLLVHMGVRIHRIYTATFAIGSGLAAAAGALLGSVFIAYPSMGDLASLKAFSVVILGGLGNIGGATVGGLVLGIAEELGAGYVSSGYRDAVGFVIIMAVLLVRPSGLFARAERVG
ncbi:MAG: branched-chain amino acid ABC transporter permease [Candidatus Rokuibacteriota bacterium]|nr:MAG: branched-chain amino acid ABC transporter permease [Candidatus Rokubacteria bacterium]